MTDKEEMTFRFEVPSEDAGSRLDVFLASRRELGLSRAQVGRIIAQGEVLVQGQVAGKGGQRLKGGELVVVKVPPPEECRIEPEAIDLDVVYEDRDLIVIDKPPGMVVHPAPGHFSGTVVNALLNRCGDLSGIGGVLRPGIVHRLDKDTSGLLVAAKNQEAHINLVSQLKKRQVKRTYLALVRGSLSCEKGVIDAPIGRHPSERKKMAVVGKGKDAISRFRVVERLPGFTLIEVKLETGRTHQIRVHLAHIGHPVVGDPTYGKQKNNLGLKRQALHATGLSFNHPITGQKISFSSPLPRDIEEAIGLLR